ncbi:MAG: TonB-dependent receptor [Pseudomonadales bacterium]|nr:TonB-dependent receptor [Pseudomonadales bacterium]
MKAQRSKKQRFLTLTTLPLLAVILPAFMVQAEEDAGEEGDWSLEEVTVTAQKREELSQDVPMSVMALNNEALEKMGFYSFDDIADKVPSLSIQPDFEKASALKVYIRGVGQEKPANFERDNGVGIYFDDVYVGHGNGLAAELNDVERIEVLAGPQGTLYGRNTIGGAVKFISAKPTGEFGFKQKLDLGNFGLFRSVTSINTAQVADISAKFTLLKSEKDGWVNNAGVAGNPGDKNAMGYRMALRWQPREDWLIDYVYDHTEQDAISNYQQHGYTKFAPNLTHLQVFPNREEKTWRTIDQDVRDDFEVSGHALTAQWSLTDNVSIKSISGYRTFDSDSLHDGTESYNVSTLVANIADQNQFSQEFLLSGFSEDSRIKYHVGLYYFKEEVDQSETSLVSNYAIAEAIDTALGAGEPIVGPTTDDLKPYNNYDIENKSQAIYAQITWTPPVWDDRLTFDLGGRYTRDNRYLSWHKPSNGGTEFPVDDADSTDNSSFDPSFTMDVLLTENMHTYFRYAQAYRSGGFDTGSERLQAFAPEDLESFELGFKSTFNENRVLFNMAIFSLDYTDIQVQFFDPGLDADQPPAKVTVNAAEASTKGAEMELKYMPVQGLLLSVAGAYLDSETTVTNPFTGETTDRLLFNTPQWKYNLAIEYSFIPTSVGVFTALVSYDYRDEELAAGSADPTDLKPDYALVGARLGLAEMPIPTGDMSLALWGKNLTDEKYEIYHNFGSVIYGEPRSYGISMIYNY